VQPDKNSNKSRARVFFIFGCKPSVENGLFKGLSDSALGETLEGVAEAAAAGT